MQFLKYKLKRTIKLFAVKKYKARTVKMANLVRAVVNTSHFVTSWNIQQNNYYASITLVIVAGLEKILKL